MASKRVRGSSTGQTPKKPPKSTKSVPQIHQYLLSCPRSNWTISEDLSLAHFIADEEGFLTIWPKARTGHSVWERASTYLAVKGHVTKRTSM